MLYFHYIIDTYIVYVRQWVDYTTVKCVCVCM